MRILSILSSAEIDDAGRGMESAFGRLSESGHEIHAVLPGDGPLAPLLEARGIRVYRYAGLPVFRRPAYWLGSLGQVLRIPLSVFWLLRLCFRLKVEVVHTNTLATPAGALAAWIYRKPHLWHIRELFEQRSWRTKFYRRSVHALSFRMIAISAVARDQFEQALRKKIRLIYDGVDAAASSRQAAEITADAKSIRSGLSADACLIGTVGPIEWQRSGQEVLVGAAALLREKYPKARYLIAGSSADGEPHHEARLREVIATYGLEQVVRILESPRAERALHAALDIEVAPPLRPPAFQHAVLEAMVAGLPVIGSRVGGVGEAVLDGVTGLLFPPGDAAALARDLDLLLADPALRQRMGEAGRQRVRNKFTIEETCHLLDVLLERTAEFHG